MDRLSAQLESLVATRQQLPATITTPTTTTNTAELQELRQKIADLKSQRQSSLFLYKPTDDEIRKIDRQITDLQARLNRTPRDVTTETRVPNPAIVEYDGKIAEAQAPLRAAQANAQALSVRADNLAKDLGRYNPIEREQAQLQRDVESSAATVLSMGQNVNDLSLRQKSDGSGQ